MAKDMTEIQSTNPQSGGVLNTLVGTGMGIATASLNDRRQERMNKKLIKQQTTAGKEMAAFNQKMGLDMWEKTGFEAQRKQMEKAGINPGLMYGGTGSGGSTQGGQATMPSSSSAPAGGGEIGMGMQMAMQMAMLKATIDNTQADTEQKKVETAKTAGVDTTKAGAETGEITQRTGNLKLDAAIKEFQIRLAEIETQTKQSTQGDAITKYKAEAQRAVQEVRSATAGANVSEATQQEQIKQITTATQEAALRVEAQKRGLIKIGAETEAINQGIKKMVAEIGAISTSNLEKWNNMSNQDKKLQIEKMIQENIRANTEFNTSTPKEIDQWVELVGDILTLGILKF